MSEVQAVAELESHAIEEMVAGLFASRKTISSKYLYDETGSQLFEEICDLPEYHVTRTEIALLQSCARDMATRLPSDSTLVEFGSGASIKTRLLLAAAPQVSAYVPIDISPSALDGAARELCRIFPKLSVEPVVADFTQAVVLPSALDASPHVGFFPGSTIGNFDPAEAGRFLTRARALLGTGARLILGADITREPAVLEPAYDDAAGVTAAFNLNLLTRLNREAEADFDLSSFHHRAIWNEEESRVEMHLVSIRSQVVEVAGRVVSFARGETIHTENSYKYSRPRLEAIASAAGWRVSAGWEGHDPAPLREGAGRASFCILMLDAQ
ncbi:MAG: L-histidine N(alpha)-methyltransferase [Sphingomonadales bacterium]|nr:L-histidine N(alpha)-methyltransferase [Sphingomonadales bacterium]MDE2170128.1 L-histidine N(alpha)-methyltransferase [Sphingomonadales bacterium]